ncbi:helix-turn-helix domain-containing protein, partial [Pisciglobus halotolerans]
MTNNHSNIKRKQAKHLSDIQRGRLEEMAKEGKLSQTKMALELGVDQSTVSRELRRGKVRQMAYDRSYYEC